MPLMHCVHWYSEKRNVFSDRPKTAAVCDGSRKFLGSEFRDVVWFQPFIHPSIQVFISKMST